MAWLAGQIFLLCLVSFLAGGALTAVVLWRKSAPTTPPEIVDHKETELEVTHELDPLDALELEAEQATEPMVIKASRKSMRYHTPDSPYYNRVKDELTFPSPAEAELAGYSAWNKAPARSSS